LIEASAQTLVRAKIAVGRSARLSSSSIAPHGVESRRPGASVDQHRRREARAALECGHRLVVCRHDDEPVDAAGDQRLDPAAFFRGVLARGDDQEIIAIALGQRFDPVHEAGEKHVGNVGDDHADEARGPAAKCAGRAVEPIVERRDRFERRVASPTGRAPLTTLEAVATDTPARSATSRMVAVLPIDRSPPGVADI
jgi:hypothetical protein